MKVAILDRNNINNFENELAIALQKFKLKGYALMGFNVSLGTKICNIDALIILESGVFICLEAKGYTGKWAGSANEKWFCDGKEIKSRGINPFTQVLDYALAVKDKLQKNTFLDQELWINFYIVAPDRADFSGVEAAVINKYQLGKSINVCNISKLEEVLGDIQGNQNNTEVIKRLGIEKVVCGLVGISVLNLQELTVSPKSSVINLAKSFTPTNLETIEEDRRRATPKPILRKKSQVSTKAQSKTKAKVSITSFLASLGIALLTLTSLASIGFLGFKYWQFSTKPRIAAKSLTIGILDDPKKYESLKTYLEDELIATNNFWQFITGDRLKVSIDGNKKLSYEEAKAKISSKKWDIAFTFSPMNSTHAKKNTYYYVARMFPSSRPFYKSALFARRDNGINKIKDLNSQTVIALGAENSASSFYMPLYNLAGETLIVKKYNRSQDIINAVRNEDADIGAAGLEDVKNDPNLKIIPVEKGKKGSRDIPGSGVYLSPRFSKYEREIMKKVMFNAPKEIQKDANYGVGNELDYSAFTKIVERVERIKECSDFKKISKKKNTSVRFFCSK